MTPQVTTTSCNRCGKPLEPGARFCANCGTAAGGTLSAVAASTTPIPAVPRPGSQPAAKPEDQVFNDLREATLGEFDVYAELGRGGMAMVYLALDLTLNRPVAIKVMSPQLMYGDGMTERFKREARTAASLSHPNIIPIYAVRETPKILYFVMKYVEGRPLDAILKETGALPLPMVQTVLTQVGGALAYAHRRGVVHRDIKPANIMIDEEGWCIVTDFGIAKVQEAKGLTSTGAMVGTPHYMSPEQYSGTALAGASDQYSLGVVAYELLGGKPPFNGETIAEVMKGHLFDPPPPVQEVRKEVPPALADIVMRMLAKKPADRFPTLDDAVKALSAVQIKEDQHVREQMVELAKTGMQHRPRISVPQSPIPASKRATPSAPTAAAKPTPVISPAQQRKRTSGIIVGGSIAAVLALAAIGYFTLPMFKASGGTPSSGGVAQQPSAVGSPAAGPAVEVPSESASGVADPQDVPTATAAAPAPALVKAAPPATKNDPAAERRALAQRRADSIRIAEGAREEARRQEAARLEAARRQDSIDAARRAVANSVTKAPARDPEPPRATAAPAQNTATAAPARGSIKIGTRAENVTLLIDNRSFGPLTGLRTFEVDAGKRTVTLTAPGCIAFDEQYDIVAGETKVIGYRAPKCP